ncbi:hypothetical protein, partial [Actinomadura miaoliensis]|uniref:hypothetical protein n=1 Tax=Actinomadura miaoliensis TaxID=430685 RepID=UPI0031E92DC9
PKPAAGTAGGEISVGKPAAAKPEPKPEAAEPEPKPEAEVTPTPEAGVTPAPAPAPEPVPRAEREPEPEAAPEPKDEAVFEPRPESKPAAPAEAEKVAEDLPVPNYDEATLPQLRARLRGLTVDQVKLLREYESKHAARADVLRMYERRIAKLNGLH